MKTRVQILRGKASQKRLEHLIRERFLDKDRDIKTLKPGYQKGYHYDPESDAWTAWDNTNIMLIIQDFNTEALAKEWLEMV
jgi:hypothetical protein